MSCTLKDCDRQNEAGVIGNVFLEDSNGEEKHMVKGGKKKKKRWSFANTNRKVKKRTGGWTGERSRDGPLHLCFCDFDGTFW